MNKTTVATLSVMISGTFAGVLVYVGVSRGYRESKQHVQQLSAELDSSRAQHQSTVDNLSADLQGCRAEIETARSATREVRKQLARATNKRVRIATDRKRAENEPGPNVAEVLASGNGHDWKQLSTRAKLEVGLLCVEKTGRHTAWTYVVFIDTFYAEGTPGASSTIETPISELVAVAAALDIEE